MCHRHTLYGHYCTDIMFDRRWLPDAGRADRRATDYSRRWYLLIHRRPLRHGDALPIRRPRTMPVSWRRGGPRGRGARCLCWCDEHIFRIPHLQTTAATSCQATVPGLQQNLILSALWTKCIEQTGENISYNTTEISLYDHYITKLSEMAKILPCTLKRGDFLLRCYLPSR